MHSVISASMPLISTLRHILTEEAGPTRSAYTRACKPSGAASARKASACGPPSSIGVASPFGGTFAMTAAST